MGTYKPSQMASAINTIGRAVLEEKTTSTVTSNGNVIVTPTNGYDGMSKVIVPVEVSGSEVTEKDVNFYDYDGTVVYSYTAQEFAQLTEMPANPDRTSDGLTAQGWNWSLVDAKTYVASYGALDIGQMYTTVSGDTEIDIDLTDPNYLHPYLALSLNGTVEVTWGDGSSVDTMTGTNVNAFTFKDHQYTTTTKYRIKIHKVTGVCRFYAFGGFEASILRVTNANSRDHTYMKCIKAVRIANDVSLSTNALTNSENMEYVTMSNAVQALDLGGYAFYRCQKLKHFTVPNGITSILGQAFSSCASLKSVSIPNGVTSFGNSAFYLCATLRRIVIPSGVTAIGNMVFGSCYSLETVVLPNTVTSIGDTAFSYTSLVSANFANATSIGASITQACVRLKSVILGAIAEIKQYAFQNCVNLQEITIPNTVTSIGQAAFQNCAGIQYLTVPAGVTSVGQNAFLSCGGMLEYHFKSTTPPTAGLNIFNGIQSGTIIYVPSASVDAYKTAAGWSTYASYIQGE